MFQPEQKRALLELKHMPALPVKVLANQYLRLIAMLTIIKKAAARLKYPRKCSTY